MTRIEDYRDWTSLDYVKVGGGVSLLLLAIVGVLLWGRRQAREDATWTETPCVVLSTDASILAGDRRASRDRYSIATSYRYEVDGMTYEGRGFGRPEAFPPGLDFLDAQEFAQAGGADGTADRCRVDPDDPTRSVFRVLDPESTVVPMRIALISLAVFLLVFVYGLQRGIRLGWLTDHR
ncbi:MAG: DUF3592 domain-containing protein [Planctomycetota bacterium JB042]